MNIIRNLFLFIFITTIVSCEVDDICIEEVLTPKLIITFQDASNNDIRKKVDTLTVWAVDKATRYNKTNTDSIAIPLDLNSNMVTYLLNSSSVIDTLQVHYTRKEIFVSRSCGYKLNFILKNETHLSHNWANDFEIKTQNIENEQTIHIQIYH